jgi:hypothetical protein
MYSKHFCHIGTFEHSLINSKFTKPKVYNPEEGRHSHYAGQYDDIDENHIFAAINM